MDRWIYDPETSNVFDEKFRLIAKCNSERDCRIIAAAPDLLRACKAVLDTQNLHHAAKRLLANAIFKAEGMPK